MRVAMKCLKKMYKIYHWDSEEAIGRNPLIRNKEQLKYYTHLMYDWISSKPLNMIIINMISYHKRVGYIWHGYEKVYFDSKNKEHINWVINNLISDIDSRLRYRIKNYFSNYFLLVSNKNGIEVAGKDWSQYLEYGTTDKTIIDLQNIGLSRHVAMIIKENYEDVL